jgi:hypothetical protein
MNETAKELTPAMIHELQKAADTTRMPVEMPANVARALEQRKFICCTNPNAHPTYPKTYFITPSGRIALSISTKGREQ